MTQTLGYPSVLIPITLTAGLALSLWRPYAGFLLAVGAMTAGDSVMFNQTRVPGFGPYLNLSDVCVLIAFVSVFLDQYRSHESPRVPQIVSFMLFALIISTCQSFWRLGWTYETLRSFRWGLEMPIAFLLGSNMIASAQRAKSLTCALFCGAVLAAIQHGVFVMSLWQTKGLSMESYHVARTITFWGGCMASAFLVASVAWPIPRGFGRVLLYVAVRLAFLATLLLNQTRSLWLGTAASIPIVAYLFDRRNWCRSMTRVAVAGLLAVFVLAPVARRFIPGLDIIELINSRVATSLQSDPEARGSATRARAFRIEMQSWMDGTLVFGRGLCFFQAIRNYPEDESRYVAFGHLGYVTYLSQAGLVGLLAYGLCLPLGVVRAGRRMWFHSSESAVRYAGLLGTASIMCVSIMFVTSAHFLSLGYFAPGVLYGAMWRLAGELPEEQCVDHMRRVDGNAA